MKPAKVKVIWPVIALSASLVGCTAARTNYSRGHYSTRS